jgi:hypothetical protein
MHVVVYEKDSPSNNHAFQLQRPNSIKGQYMNYELGRHKKQQPWSTHLRGVPEENLS